MGFSLDIPEEFNNTKGIFLPFPFPTVKDGIYQMMFNYYAFSKAESDEFNEKAKAGGLSPEDTARILNAQGVLMVVLGIDGNRSAEDLIAFLEMEDADASAFTEVGKHDDITYYAVTDLSMYADFAEGLGITTLPTTLFVGRDGTILLTPIVGVPSDLSQYTALIDAFLASFAPAA